MNSLPELDDAKWLMLLEQVNACFDKETLHRGHETYSKLQVQALSAIAGNGEPLIQAQVHVTDEIQFEVKLNVSGDLASSVCNCPVPKLCRHIAAVMMAYADRWGYSPLQLINPGHFLRRADTEKKVNEQTGQLPSMSVEQWHEYMAAYTKTVRPSFSDHAYIEELKGRLAGLDEQVSRLPRAEGLFFELHRKVFVLAVILRPDGTRDARRYTPYWNMNAFRGVSQWIEEQGKAVDAMDAAIPAGAVYSPAERVGQTLGYIRRQLKEETDYSYYMMYVAVWEHWIAPGGKREALGDWAARELAELDKLPSGVPPINAAKAYLHVRQRSADAAWEALQSANAVDSIPQHIYTFFLDCLCEDEDWAGLVAWLSRLAPYYQHARTSLAEYIAYWQKAVPHAPSAEAEMWKRMEELLPRSRVFIENILYEQREWKRWIEYQLLAGISPLDYRVSVLQPIEKEAPELLLPYYHQFVDRHIALKNRRDYKIAVKMLKRLKKLYNNRLKIPERWELFLAYFMERYSRLRALQEEMQKGKLTE